MMGKKTESIEHALTSPIHNKEEEEEISKTTTNNVLSSNETAAALSLDVMRRQRVFRLQFDQKSSIFNEKQKHGLDNKNNYIPPVQKEIAEHKVHFLNNFPAAADRTAPELFFKTLRFWEVLSSKAVDSECVTLKKSVHLCFVSFDQNSLYTEHTPSLDLAEIFYSDVPLVLYKLFNQGPTFSSYMCIDTFWFTTFDNNDNKTSTLSWKFFQFSLLQLISRARNEIIAIRKRIVKEIVTNCIFNAKNKATKKLLLKH